MYIQRKNQVIEQADQIRDAKKDLQSKLLDKSGKRKKKNDAAVVPKFIKSSKHIMAEKKIKQAGLDEFGNKK